MSHRAKSEDPISDKYLGIRDGNLASIDASSAYSMGNLILESGRGSAIFSQAESGLDFDERLNNQVKSLSVIDSSKEPITTTTTASIDNQADGQQQSKHGSRTRTRKNKNNPRFLSIRDKINGVSRESFAESLTASGILVRPEFEFSVPLVSPNNYIPANPTDTPICNIPDETSDATEYQLQLSFTTSTSTDYRSTSALSFEIRFATSILQSVSLFNERPDLYFALKPFIKLKSFDKDQVIQEQGSLIDTFYWIIEGSCSVIQKVSFVQNKIGLLKPLPRSSSPAGTILEKDEVIVEQSIESHSLDKLSFFPFLHTPTQQDKPLTKETLLQNHKSLPSDCTITIAESKTTLAIIKASDLIENVSIPMLIQLNQSAAFRFDAAFLEDELIQQARDYVRRSIVPMNGEASLAIDSEYKK